MAEIIIIDDDPVFSTLLASYHAPLGHKTITARTLEEGKRLLAAKLFDLVFLDISLPDGDDLQFLPFIQQLPSSPEVIIMTSSGSSDGAELAIKSGVWNYFEKPVSRQQIIWQRGVFSLLPGFWQ